MATRSITVQAPITYYEHYRLPRRRSSHLLDMIEIVPLEIPVVEAADAPVSLRHKGGPRMHHAAKEYRSYDGHCWRPLSDGFNRSEMTVDHLKDKLAAVAADPEDIGNWWFDLPWGQHASGGQNAFHIRHSHGYVDRASLDEDRFDHGHKLRNEAVKKFKAATDGLMIVIDGQIWVACPEPVIHIRCETDPWTSRKKPGFGRTYCTDHFSQSTDMWSAALRMDALDRIREVGDAIGYRIHDIEVDFEVVDPSLLVHDERRAALQRFLQLAEVTQLDRVVRLNGSPRLEQSYDSMVARLPSDIRNGRIKDPQYGVVEAFEALRSLALDIPRRAHDDYFEHLPVNLKDILQIDAALHQEPALEASMSGPSV